MMPCIAVVPLNTTRVLFASHMLLRRQNIRKRIPMVRVKSTGFQVFDLVIPSPEGRSITIAEHPAHGSPWATISGVYDPGRPSLAKKRRQRNVRLVLKAQYRLIFSDATLDFRYLITPPMFSYIRV